MSHRAIFLDRDDTLIADPGYINDPDQVELLPGVGEALVDLRRLGYKLVVVSNQSAVARGIVTEEKLEDIHQRLKTLLASKKAYLDKIYYCPFFAEGAIEKYRVDSDMRKPRPGMLLKAADELDIDLANSWMIGDSLHDVEAGRRAGCRTILVDGRNIYKPLSKGDVQPEWRAVNLREAVNIIKLEIRAEKELATSARAVTKVEAKVEDEVAAAEEPEPQAEAVEESAGVRNETEECLSEAQAVEEITEQQTQAESYQEQAAEGGNSEYLLAKILEQLKVMQRNEMFEEFSVIRLLAGVAQGLVFLCLLMAVWFLMAMEKNLDAIYMSLGFGILFQVMSLTLYVMNRKR